MGMPPARGLYDPRFEHDACGVSFVVDVHGRASHRIVSLGLGALCNMEHRGATGAEPDTGDGAGVLLQVPHGFLAAVTNLPLPAAGRYGTGLAFLPVDEADRRAAVAGIERIAREEGLVVLGWRDVPVDPSGIGATARAAMPAFAQVFLADPRGAEGLALDRLLWVARKRIEHELTGARATYFPSLSCRTLVYKGMLTTPQLGAFFPDLTDPRMETAMALVHSRFSTNTFPSWPLAHPYRYVAHNGEINTVQGNRNWMRTRESMLRSDLIPGLARALPIVTPNGSDSMSLDEVLELLHLGGRSLPHAVMMMIPEAWENDATMDPARRDFYRFHAALMEPWDGPAAVSFTDGTVIGAVLDRNGLRPGRWCETSDGLVVLASESGVAAIDPGTVVRKGRLQPGRMFLVDTTKGRIVDDDEIKAELVAMQPWGEWLREGMVSLTTLPAREHVVHSRDSVLRRQQVFGWTNEDLKLIVAPMARSGAEPIGSMGTDTPIAVLSTRPRLLFDYFQQLFAQVTNPPLDAIREEVVTSVGTSVGPEGNLLGAGPDSCRQLTLPYPVISNGDLAKILHINDDATMNHLQSATVGCLYRVADGGAGLRDALNRVCADASAAIADGARIVVLSDRNSDEVWAPIPSLLSTAAVHHHLIREQVRTRAGLVVECGDAREVHHMALLIGYGAGAINPYLAFETIEHMIAGGVGDDDGGGAHGLVGLDPSKAVANYLKAVGKGVLKVMSKMGVSTVASYTGAQIFEAIGIGREVVDRYFTGTVSRIGGIGLDDIATEVAARHAIAYPQRSGHRLHRRLEAGGEYQWRREGELHLFNPETVYRLQHATRSGRYDLFRHYTRAVDDQSHALCTLRGLFTLVPVGAPVPVDEVEPVSSIVKRFSTGAMSYGSISAEAHETLAIAMNRLGAKSNTGEGGEDPERNVPLPTGDSRRSAIKQVASGRFGVTSEYLVNADDLQIKMAQGAKPGEGGQLPGHKVYPWIARTRYSTPGVGLISPPPHHDIYSIEDLKQLIHDLKNANRHARVHVKLVAEVGVGTVAAGVSKARADVVLISGHDGGTGASPLTSLKHAGAPWELGLAEAQQVLVMNGLRDRIVVQADGQLKTGRDVVVAALLGAEEFGFATAPLVVSGCVMMRVCHLDTCPVGVATQNPELRRRFTGKPEFVVNFFEFVAQEVREHLAALGFRSLAEAVGRTEALDVRGAVDHWKAAGLDLSAILMAPDNRYARPVRHATAQDHGLDATLDRTLIDLAAPAIAFGHPVDVNLPVSNVDRTVGTMLGSEITRAHGGAGLPDDTIRITLTGSAGQSLGAFLPSGITIALEGDANDYVAKGLSGGIIAIRPDRRATFAPEDNVIAGNVIGYGATSGRLYVSGRVGERFCVRNSGAIAVVEGTGDHGCEYMTGGRVVVLGGIGRNFAAGMSGGLAFLLDVDGTAAARVNGEMVDVQAVSDDDREWLRATVDEHARRTASPLARRLLDAWEATPFVAVVPRDYARVLAIAEEARREGLDDDAIATRIMERVNG